MKRQSAIAALLCVLMVTIPALATAQQTSPPSAAAGEAGAGANAAELIRAAQRALGEVVKTAREDPKLKPEAADAKPFWEAMKTANESLDKADTGLTLKDDTFHSNLALSVAAAQQAEIALVMNDLGSAAVSEALTELSGILTALDENYSKEASRRAGGDELTPEERRQLDKLKKEQDELDKKLAEVEKKIGTKDKRIKQGIEKIRKNSQQIRRCGYSGGEFVAGMIAARSMWGWIWGWHWWWGPWGYWGPGYIGINIDIWDVWVDAVPYDWDLVDTYLDVDDLGLDEAYFADEFDAVDLAETDAWLDDGDFSLEEVDMVELTDELPVGWDEVETDAGLEVMGGFQDNFDHIPFESDFGGQIDTFDDFGGFDDFGADFGGDFGGFGDW